MIVSAPGSTANLGAGFDGLGLAIGLRFWLSDTPVPGLVPAEPTHPAAVAFAEAFRRSQRASADRPLPELVGPTRRPLWWRSPIPPGRGLGFSGASRVAGAYLALRIAGWSEPAAEEDALRVAGRLEGHLDNAAPSARGGFCVAAGDHVTRVQTPLDPVVVVWWPPETTSTDGSRGRLPATVPFADAVFNLTRSALFVAAWAAGDPSGFAEATRDRLHQDLRLQGHPGSARVLRSLLHDGVDDPVRPWGAWVSGSGPTIAALCDRGTAVALKSRLPAEGTARVLEVDDDGVRVEEGFDPPTP